MCAVSFAFESDFEEFIPWNEMSAVFFARESNFEEFILWSDTMTCSITTELFIINICSFSRFYINTYYCSSTGPYKIIKSHENASN